MAKRAAAAKGDDGGEDTTISKKRGRFSIGERKLKALLSSKRKTTEAISELAGGLGSEVKTAVDKHYLNRKAFGWIAQIDRMEPEKAKMMVEDFLLYLDLSGINARIEKVQSLPMGERQDEEEEDDDEAGRGQHAGGRNGGTGRPFPTPAGASSE